MTMPPLEIIQQALADACAGRLVTSPAKPTGPNSSYFYTLPTNHSNTLLKELDISIGRVVGNIGSFDTSTQKLISYELANNPNEFANVLRQSVNRKSFYDLGCGSPSNSFIVRFLVEQLGANGYVGVDLEKVESHQRVDEFNNGNGFTSEFVRENLLTFLVDYNRNQTEGKVFYISGLEHDSHKDPDHRYIGYAKMCIKNISDCSKSNDVIIIGPRTNGFFPERFGYNCIYGDKSVHSHSIYQKT